MVRHCAWGTCTNDERYPEKMKDCTFIPFPRPKTDFDKCLRWIKACGRPHDQLNVSRINKHNVVCSKVRDLTLFASYFLLSLSLSLSLSHEALLWIGKQVDHRVEGVLLLKGQIKFKIVISNRKICRYFHTLLSFE